MSEQITVDNKGASPPAGRGGGAAAQQALEQERYELLHRLEDWLETPLIFLGFAWLALLILELLYGTTVWFETAGTVIWVIFVLDFGVKLLVAPHKLAFLKGSWLTAVSLLVPALRVFRVVRVLAVLKLARAGRGLRLLSVVGSLNRGMGALGASMRRRGFGYVVALTVLVTFVGAAGMYAFEHDERGGRGFENYGAALWWTAMIMTTMGSEQWPQTLEGRLLCLLLALYAFAVFGYVTATLATFFIGRDAEDEEAELAGAKSLAALQAEIAALRGEIRALTRRGPQGE